MVSIEVLVAQGVGCRVGDIRGVRKGLVGRVRFRGGEIEVSGQMVVRAGISGVRR